MKSIILTLAAFAGVYAQTAKFPAAVVTIQDLGKAKDASSSTLNGGINNSTLTVVVADGSQFTANQIVQIDSEQMQICSIATNTLTICTGTRGFAGTSAASHLSGAAVRGVMVSWYINALAAEVVAIAGRVLPARAATSAPGTCVASKDLFVDTDDLTLSVCNATGDGWNAITSAASSGVRVCATGGTSTAYTCTVSGSISTNDLLLLVPHTASGASPTLNVNSGGAVDLYRRSGNAVGSNYLASGSGYLIRKAASTWVITEQDITAGANGTLTCTNGVCDTTALVCITTGACAPTGLQDHSAAAGWLPVTRTVATLPAAAGVAGQVFMVTDAASVTSLGAGGGSTRAWFVSNGSAYVALGGGSGTTESRKVLCYASSASNVVGDGTAKTFASCNVSAGEFEVGDVIRHTSFVKRMAGSGEPIVRGTIGNGGAPTTSFTVAAANIMTLEWVVTGATTAVLRAGHAFREPIYTMDPGGGYVANPSNFDVAATTTFTLDTTGVHIPVGTEYRLMSFMIERIRP